jgi:hypothetical protein
MKKIIKKIIPFLIIIVLVLIILSISYFRIERLKKENSKLIGEKKTIIEMNDKEIEKYEQQISDKNNELNKLKKEAKYYTQKELDDKSNEEKDIIINKLQNKYKALLLSYEGLLFEHNELLEAYNICNIQLKETVAQLEKTNKALSKVKKPFGFGFDVSGGLSGFNNYGQDNFLKADLTIGGHAVFNLFNNRISLMPGGYIKPYDDLGFGVKFGFNINFRKMK